MQETMKNNNSTSDRRTGSDDNGMTFTLKQLKGRVRLPSVVRISSSHGVKKREREESHR